MLYNAFAPSREPAMSLLLEVTAPSAGEPEEDSGTQVQFLIILASSFDALQVHLNLGGELTDGGDSAVLLGAGVLLQAGPLTPTIELSASTSAQETTLNIVPGLHWRANASTDLSIGASAGIAGSNQFAILSAVTVEF
jgi:hypothetical protein